MKAQSRTLLIALALAAASRLAPAQTSVITSFSQNGLLICSNLMPGSAATVSWASSLAGPWQTNWTTLSAVPVGTNGTLQVAVPMFFRVLSVTNTTPLVPITLQQLWGSNTMHLATDAIQTTSVPTLVNTAFAVFDAAHTTIWMPVSFVPDWSVGTQVYWGSPFNTMRVVALGAGQIQFQTISGFFGWKPGAVISPALSFKVSSAMTAAANWRSPGVSNTVVLSAAALSATVGDMVWVGGIGGDQFRVLAISP
jgi:hypothetical protein